MIVERMSMMNETNVNTTQPIMPWVYILEKYKPEMLQLPMMAIYDSYGDHGLRYVERFERQGENALCGHTEKNEVKFS